jgi:REP element-mobilizing transposase RayT
MSHSYAQNHLHIVFSTKERKKRIDKQMQLKRERVKPCDSCALY